MTKGAPFGPLYTLMLLKIYISLDTGGKILSKSVRKRTFRVLTVFSRETTNERSNAILTMRLGITIIFHGGTIGNARRTRISERCLPRKKHKTYRVTARKGQLNLPVADLIKKLLSAIHCSNLEIARCERS